MCYIPLLRFQSHQETCVSRSYQSNNARASASYYSRRHGGNHLGALPHPALAAGCHSPRIPCEQPRLCRGPFPASATRLYTIWSVKDLRQDVHVLGFSTLDSHKGPLPRKAPLESGSGVFCISVCAIRPVQLSFGDTSHENYTLIPLSAKREAIKSQSQPYYRASTSWVRLSDLSQRRRCIRRRVKEAS